MSEKKLFERKVKVTGATPNEAQVFNLAIEEFKKIKRESIDAPLRNHERGLESLLAKRDMISKTLQAIPRLEEHKDLIEMHEKELKICEDSIKQYEDNLEKIQTADKFYNDIIIQFERMIKEQILDDHVLYTYDVRIDQTLFAKMMTLLFQIEFKEENEE